MLRLELGFGLGVSPEADYPDLPARGYHLRFTRRALEDLHSGFGADVLAGVDVTSAGGPPGRPLYGF